MKIPQPGDKAPAFSLPDQDGHIVSLKNFKGWLVLYTYPRDLTPGCSMEAHHFSKLKSEFAKLGAEIVGVSADTQEKHCKFREKKGLTITLLSDVEKTLLTAYGCFGEKKFMGKTYDGIHRRTFLIKDAKVMYVWEKVRILNHVQTVLDKLKELS